ncbi:ribosomal protein S8 [Hypoxylon argillaceum]|nr:ribosomal protein S8 [Hypoxylon argillaceum]KAI1149042.1 ribosomal protein S8 [Nemania diffusa]
MGSHAIANMASHLSNASRARLGITSVPHTKYTLGVALAMHRAGFLSFVTRGGKHPPDPATVATFEPEALTSANVAQQRLWVGLKYRGDAPVMGKMTAISTPKRRVTAKLPALERLARGLAVSSRQGVNIGECIFLTTDVGTLEVREAVQKKVGGMLLCRVGP